MADTPRPLTPLQARFVQEYLLDLNATAAYRRAGYKCKTDNAAAASSSELLRNPKIAGAVRAAQASRSERVTLDADYVLTRLRENVERSMQAVEVKDSKSVSTGEWKYEGAVANKALELLGKHLGLFVERHEVTGKNGGKIPVEMTHHGLPSAAAVEALIQSVVGREGGTPPLRGDGLPEPVHPPHA